MKSLEELLVLPQTVKIKWNRKHIVYYKQKGYNFSKVGLEFEVNVLDLSPGSNKKVKCICQYCNNEVEKKFGEINKLREKICCKKCSLKKIKQTNLKKYGVENILTSDEIKEKIKQTNLKKYGVENAIASDEIKKKIKQTNLKKYGVESITQTELFKEKTKQTNIKKYGCKYASQSQYVKDKVKNTILDKYGCENISQIPEVKKQKSETWFQTIYQNQSGPSSKQQRYLRKILKGELNYAFDKCLLDIAFPNEMIYLEYDGGAHDLNVKLGKLSKEEFSKREKNREIYLKSKGWKLIRIISRKDYLPQDNEIISLINESKEYLKTGHFLVEIDIDNKTFKCSEFKRSLELSLRRIKKEEV